MHIFPDQSVGRRLSCSELERQRLLPRPLVVPHKALGIPTHYNLAENCSFEGRATERVDMPASGTAFDGSIWVTAVSSVALGTWGCSTGWCTINGGPPDNTVPPQMALRSGDLRWHGGCWQRGACEQSAPRGESSDAICPHSSSLWRAEGGVPACGSLAGQPAPYRVLSRPPALAPRSTGAVQGGLDGARREASAAKQAAAAGQRGGAGQRRGEAAGPQAVGRRCSPTNAPGNAQTFVDRSHRRMSLWTGLPAAFYNSACWQAAVQFWHFANNSRAAAQRQKAGPPRPLTAAGRRWEHQAPSRHTPPRPRLPQHTAPG